MSQFILVLNRPLSRKMGMAPVVVRTLAAVVVHRLKGLPSLASLGFQVHIDRTSIGEPFCNLNPLATAVTGKQTLNPTTACHGEQANLTGRSPATEELQQGFRANSRVPLRFRH